MMTVKNLFAFAHDKGFLGANFFRCIKEPHGKMSLPTLGRLGDTISFLPVIAAQSLAKSTGKAAVRIGPMKKSKAI